MPLSALIRRGFLSLVLAVAVTLTPTRAPLAQSSDNSRYAAIVVDAETGEVLFARHADSRRYPASITKVMTLYLAFEALAEGKIKLDDVITVSPRAASQPPSKLGLAAGQTITVDDAMRATSVRSANDMAMALAEHIGGSQDRFAAQATLKARELGMTQTRYVNPNGLPDARQLTSARDLAILARAVMRDYPQYYRYFGLHDWAYNGRDYRNTNGLLRGGNGYDGMKTGYTNASGYNLAASAVRDGRRLITIVLGGRSTASRNAHVAALMDTGFEVERARARGETIQVAQTFFEARGFGIGPDNSGPVEYASTADDEDGETGVGSSAPPSGSVTYAALPASPVQPARVTPPPSERAAVERPADVTAILNGGAPVAAPPRPRPPAAREPARQSAGRWSVQVGAFRDESVARDWLTEVNRRFRSQFTAAERTVQNAEGWYRSRFTGMTEQGAQSACAALAERRVTCMVVRPE
ncbi:D-alanyl-D-alanine carboxypeptidase [Brevundimonas sp. UBA7664]|uniref:D-alanyl-D-alanine carboxypeptidase n=1 Tax=Brevundimonas sp. UBA7664 TaxID=1946141 RepID=UPI0025C16F70|nr:D-alanyl-D-alanine carboxypeptidase [Brevundimonas sp. UBA7664]